MKKRSYPTKDSELLSRYLEGDLGNTESEQVESLLETSEELKQDFDFLKYTLDCMGQMSNVEAPENFAGSVRHQIRRTRKTQRKETVSPSSSGNRLTYILLTGTVICMMMILYLMFQLSLVPVSTTKGVSPSKGTQVTTPTKPPTRTSTTTSN